jgi:hypothetical protein
MYRSHAWSGSIWKYERGVRSYLQMIRSGRLYRIQRAAHADANVLGKLQSTEPLPFAILPQAEGGLNGWRPLSEIRRMDLPAIVVSSACSPLHVVEVAAKRARDFLSKPISADVPLRRGEATYQCDSWHMRDIQALLAEV